MYTIFKTSKLEKCYRKPRKAEAAWGKAVAQKYIQAVNLLRAVDRPSDLRGFRLFNYHQLKADRKGQCALKLGERVRLIFTVCEKQGLVTVRIEEVNTTHYDH
ncbi:MAG: plasmid maintenance system killer [Armatimonadetes bacterium]|nr:plasmid maintenance system killer [Armatimonadota bacterium]NIM24682.1 plasmid maintenance system killer [Armatimonadota bacterium]NIM68561.1 plasmid maintenance system killer [Armatimonadota bacterium]NIM76941.1 plasmid maintenance system killer [Armatimonadota bacterium]NIN06755.1 plasmid maintenance system killer [Armatimonadota bacterium]